MEPWICPRCQTVYAPWVAQCNCPKPTITVSGLGTVCTCIPGSTAVCPIYQVTGGTTMISEWNDEQCTRTLTSRMQ